VVYLSGMAAGAATATLRWVLQLHRDVPRAAKFYAEGLDFSVNVCSLRWAELQSGPLKLALMHTHDGYDCCYLCSMVSCIGRGVILYAFEEMRWKGSIHRLCATGGFCATRSLCSMKCVCGSIRFT
jgi:hypothetical protein